LQADLDACLADDGNARPHPGKRGRGQKLATTLPLRMSPENLKLIEQPAWVGMIEANPNASGKPSCRSPFSR
jgi:hypothetical protein